MWPTVSSGVSGPRGLWTWLSSMRTWKPAWFWSVGSLCAAAVNSSCFPLHLILGSLIWVCGLWWTRLCLWGHLDSLSRFFFFMELQVLNTGHLRVKDWDWPGLGEPDLFIFKKCENHQQTDVILRAPAHHSPPGWVFLDRKSLKCAH